MKTQMQDFTQASLWKDKQYIEQRFLDLAFLGQEDLQICEPIIDELLPLSLAEGSRLVSLAEAVWLKMAAELLRSNFDLPSIYRFRYAMLGPIVDPEEENQWAPEEIVEPEEFFRTLDFLMGLVAMQKQDVLIQFNRAGKMGFKIGFDESLKLKTNCLTFSVHHLINQIENTNLQLEEHKAERVSNAEAVLLEVARNPSIKEFQVAKGSQEDTYQWDLLIHKEGLATRRKLHELMHSSLNGHGIFHIISNNRSKSYYKQTQRLRF